MLWDQPSASNAQPTLTLQTTVALLTVQRVKLSMKQTSVVLLISLLSHQATITPQIIQTTLTRQTQTTNTTRTLAVTQIAQLSSPSPSQSSFSWLSHSSSCLLLCFLNVDLSQTISVSQRISLSQMMLLKWEHLKQVLLNCE